MLRFSLWSINQHDLPHVLTVIMTFYIPALRSMPRQMPITFSFGGKGEEYDNDNAKASNTTERRHSIVSTAPVG